MSTRNGVNWNSRHAGDVNANGTDMNLVGIKIGWVIVAVMFSVLAGYALWALAR